jgi:hypothetical protein
VSSQLHGGDFRNLGLPHVGVEGVPQVLEREVCYSPSFQLGKYCSTGGHW